MGKRIFRSKSHLLRLSNSVHHWLTLVLPALAILSGCDNAPGEFTNSNVRYSLMTRTAVRCQDGAALLFFEPHLEISAIPAGERARFYLGQTMLKDTLADANGYLSFTTSISRDRMPQLSLVLGDDSLFWDPADSMAVDDTNAAPFQVAVHMKKDSGQGILSLVTLYSLLASERGRRIPCEVDLAGVEVPLDEYGSYNATRYSVDADVVAVGNRYSFSAANGAHFDPDSIFKEQEFQFPVLQVRTAPLQRKRIIFEGTISHFPVTLEMTLGMGHWRYHISQD